MTQPVLGPDRDEAVEFYADARAALDARWYADIVRLKARHATEIQAFEIGTIAWFAARRAQLAERLAAAEQYCDQFRALIETRDGTINKLDGIAPVEALQ